MTRKELFEEVWYATRTRPGSLLLCFLALGFMFYDTTLSTTQILIISTAMIAGTIFVNYITTPLPRLMNRIVDKGE